AAVAGPQLQRSAVDVAGRDVATGHVQAQAGLNAGDGAVRVQPPLLVGASVAGPDLNLGARGGLVVVRVQALGAGIDAQFARGGRSPRLVGAAVAVVDLHRRTVGLGRPVHVRAPVRRRSHQR